MVMEKKGKIYISLLLMVGIILTFLLSCEKDDDLDILSDCETSAVFNPDKNYGQLIDQEGNVYKTIEIGSQIWMAENLRTTIYRNGDPIPEITDSLTWINLNTGAYCNYNNTERTDTICTYGRLYNWFAVNDARNIAPEGWHVPSLDEWLTMVEYLGNDTIAADKMKETGSLHWKKGWNEKATNASGFTAIPGGYRPKGFVSMGEFGYWWTATEGGANDRAWHQHLYYFGDWVGGCDCPKIYGKSIRLIKD
jgi:uncharacterized protein (TIGR02145 family)